jgi:uncharacterized protein with HEPN domain
MMPRSRSALLRLDDMLAAIERIEAFTRGKTFEQFASDRMLADAVERNIERISEASRRIPDTLKTPAVRYSD